MDAHRFTRISAATLLRPGATEGGKGPKDAELTRETKTDGTEATDGCYGNGTKKPERNDPAKGDCHPTVGGMLDERDKPAKVVGFFRAIAFPRSVEPVQWPFAPWQPRRQTGRLQRMRRRACQ